MGDRWKHRSREEKSRLEKDIKKFFFIDLFLAALDLHCWKWKLLSRVRLFVTPLTVQSMRFSRPEYWSGYPFPSPGDLPNPGIEPRSPALQVGSLPAEPQGKPLKKKIILCIYFGCAGSSLLLGPFSSCGEQGPLWLWCAGLSWWLLLWNPGSRACGLQQLQHVGSEAVAPGALEHRLGSHGTGAESPWGMWGLPRSGIKPVSLALAGAFFTAKPPGKPWRKIFWNDLYIDQTFSEKCQMVNNLGFGGKIVPAATVRLPS